MTCVLCNEDLEHPKDLADLYRLAFHYPLYHPEYVLQNPEKFTEGQVALAGVRPVNPGK